MSPRPNYSLESRAKILFKIHAASLEHPVSAWRLTLLEVEQKKAFLKQFPFWIKLLDWLPFLKRIFKVPTILEDARYMLELLESEEKKARAQVKALYDERRGEGDPAFEDLGYADIQELYSEPMQIGLEAKSFATWLLQRETGMPEGLAQLMLSHSPEVQQQISQKGMQLAGKTRLPMLSFIAAECLACLSPEEQSALVRQLQLKAANRGQLEAIDGNYHQ